MAQTPSVAKAGSETRQIIEGFGKTHDVDRYFADDAEYFVLPLGQQHQGKEQIEGLFKVFYHDALSPAVAEVRRVVADEESETGVLEFVFKGKHVGPQLGFPATNMDVELPMIAIYEVQGNLIRTARLYFDSASLMRQLGM